LNSVDPQPNIVTDHDALAMANNKTLFFKLPAELRNQIYSYVLDRRGQFHPAAIFTTQHTSKAVYEGVDITAMYQSTQPQTLNVSVLTDYNVGATVMTRCRASKLQALNQLQYVSKQLHNETAQLTFEYNKDQIAIERSLSWEDASGRQLCAWMNSVDVYQVSQLGEVTIKLSDVRSVSSLELVPWVSDTIETMHELTGLLNACPNITVKYILQGWTLPKAKVTHEMFARWTELTRAYHSTFVQKADYSCYSWVFEHHKPFIAHWEFLPRMDDRQKFYMQRYVRRMQRDMPGFGEWTSRLISQGF